MPHRARASVTPNATAAPIATIGSVIVPEGVALDHFLPHGEAFDATFVRRHALEGL